MVTKKDLLLKASTETDKERFKKLIVYDLQQGGVMLYRYRHLARSTTKREIKALVFEYLGYGQMKKLALRQLFH